MKVIALSGVAPVATIPPVTPVAVSRAELMFASQVASVAFQAIDAVVASVWSVFGTIKTIVPPVAVALNVSVCTSLVPERNMVPDAELVVIVTRNGLPAVEAVKVIGVAEPAAVCSRNSGKLAELSALYAATSPVMIVLMLADVVVYVHAFCP